MHGVTDQALEGVSAMELSQVTAPLSESDREWLAEFWARMIAESGAQLPRPEASAGGARPARRAERQRADRLVRVLSTTCRGAGSGTGVAA